MSSEAGPPSSIIGRIRAVGGRIRAPFEGPNTFGNSTAFWVVFAIVVGWFAIYPQLTDPFSTLQTTRYFALAFLGLSLCFVWGYCGILSFGQVAFFGGAGYMFGIIAINYGSATGITAALFGAVLFGTVFALVLGYFMFYGGVSDVYVTIITLVVALVLGTFMDQTAGSEWAVGDARLGGFNGMRDIPDLTLGFGSSGFEVGGEVTTYYYFVFGSLIVTYLALRVLVNSSFGMTMVAVREDPNRTETFGYNVPFVKLVVFSIGGALAAFGGVLHTAQDNIIDPDVFAITFAALPVIWVSIGGRESLLGAMAATVAIEQMRTELAGTGSEWALVIVGSALLFVILVMPSGIVPTVDRLLKRLFEKLPSLPGQTPTAGQPEGDD